MNIIIQHINDHGSYILLFVLLFIMILTITLYCLLYNLNICVFSLVFHFFYVVLMCWLGCDSCFAHFMCSCDRFHVCVAVVEDE